MTAQLRLRTDDVEPLRAHYQGVAFNVLWLLWAYKLLIAAFVVAGSIAALAAVVLLPPRFTAEAILQVNFNREETNGPVRIQRIASLEAGAIVESALRVLRSRPLASAVVSRMGLADEPEFTRASRSQRILTQARQWLELPVLIPSAQDTATERLMGALRINIVPRSYIISVAINSSDPERAAQIVNAVVLEYIRGQQIQQLTELRKGIEREIADMSSIFGGQHPRSIDAREKLRELQGRIDKLDTHTLDEGTIQLFGDFHPAEPVMIPSGPNVMLIFALVIAAFLLACGMLIFIVELVRSRATSLSRHKLIVEVSSGDKPFLPKSS